MTCSLLWLIFRQIFHRLLVTRWLTAKAAQWCSLRAVHEKDVEYRQEAAKQAALVYHQLHQLHLTGEYKNIKRAEARTMRLNYSLVVAVLHRPVASSIFGGGGGTYSCKVVIYRIGGTIRWLYTV